MSSPPGREVTRRPSLQPLEADVGPVGGFESQILRETMSAAGRRVQMSLERNSYRDARPYYVIAYEPRDEGAIRGAREVRYVPEVYGVMPGEEDPGRAARSQMARRRADFLFDQFCRDITRPSALRDRKGSPSD
jgi:hypothetical protein